MKRVKIRAAKPRKGLKTATPWCADFVKLKPTMVLVKSWVEQGAFYPINWQVWEGLDAKGIRFAIFNFEIAVEFTFKASDNDRRRSNGTGILRFTKDAKSSLPNVQRN
jgi:hypothetical protein